MELNINESEIFSASLGISDERTAKIIHNTLGIVNSSDSKTDVVKALAYAYKDDAELVFALFTAGGASVMKAITGIVPGSSVSV